MKNTLNGPSIRTTRKFLVEFCTHIYQQEIRSANGISWCNACGEYCQTLNDKESIEHKDDCIVLFAKNTMQDLEQKGKPHENPEY